jgi:hypothetical protein
MALIGSKDWVVEAPVSRILFLVLIGEPVAPCVEWKSIYKGVDER